MVPLLPSPDPKRGFARQLVRWYERGHRDLPWRRTRNPYRIWVSEIMLQQTRVDTVLPYYRRFLRRYPSVRALARAPRHDVLKVWEGLGYYARCRNLHRTAQQLVHTQGGRFPDDLERLLALPGIGRSTAGAILTFAMGQSHPLLDGNVKRVLARLYDLAADPRRAQVERWLWERSAELLAQSRDPGSFNQAIIELGAVVCTPREPDCSACPVRSLCAARAASTQQERPLRAKRPPLPHHAIGVGVVHKRGWLLIQRRPDQGLLGGLWEFPGGKQLGGESLRQTVRREIREELGIRVRVEDPITVVRHAYTHFRITLHAFHCQWLSGRPRPRVAQAVRWVRRKALSDYAFPRANQKVLEALEP